MSQSLVAVHAHLVFSTRERRAVFRDPPVRQALHAYLGGISKNLECPPIRIGGVEDHVHILASLGRTITLADWVKELKRASNLWVQEQGQAYAGFHWQGGYAAFSVSQSNLAQVGRYIEDQESHHHRITFQDELRTLFRKHNIKFDERYVWD